MQLLDGYSITVLVCARPLCPLPVNLDEASLHLLKADLGMSEDFSSCWPTLAR